jgi:hypothetical protein
MVRPVDDVPGAAGVRGVANPERQAAIEARGTVFDRGGTHGSPTSPLLPLEHA